MTNGAQFLTPKEYEAVRAILDDREKIRESIREVRDYAQKAGNHVSLWAEYDSLKMDHNETLAAYVEQLVGM